MDATLRPSSCQIKPNTILSTNEDNKVEGKLYINFQTKIEASRNRLKAISNERKKNTNVLLLQSANTDQ